MTPPKAEAILALEEIERALKDLEEDGLLIRHPDFNTAYIDVGLTSGVKYRIAARTWAPMVIADGEAAMVMTSPDEATKMLVGNMLRDLGDLRAKLKLGDKIFFAWRLRPKLCRNVDFPSATQPHRKGLYIRARAAMQIVHTDVVEEMMKPAPPLIGLIAKAVAETSETHKAASFFHGDMRYQIMLQHNVYHVKAFDRSGAAMFSGVISGTIPELAIEQFVHSCQARRVRQENRDLNEASIAAFLDEVTRVKAARKAKNDGVDPASEAETKLCSVCWRVGGHAPSCANINPHKPVILAGHSEAPLDAPYQRIPVGSYIIAVPFGVPIGKEIIRVPHASYDSERVFLWDLRDAARRLLVARCTGQDRHEGRDVRVHRPSDHDLSALADHFKAEKQRQVRIDRHDVAMGLTSERETENARRIAQAFAAPAPAAATFSDLSASPPACRMLPRV